jgi:hypothetical protein
MKPHQDVVTFLCQQQQVGGAGSTAMDEKKEECGWIGFLNLWNASNDRRRRDPSSASNTGDDTEDTMLVSGDSIAATHKLTKQLLQFDLCTRRFHLRHIEPDYNILHAQHHIIA